MSRTHTLIVVVILALFGQFTVALAQGTPPANVTEVTATLENGTVTVHWKTVTDTVGIDHYRVYYSRKSILENGGDYDDFESTDGPVTSFVFPAAPVSGPVMYISVMAVNAMGMESEGFEAEARVGLSEAAEPAMSSAQETPAVSEVTPFAFEGILAVSQTGIVLQFNKPLRGSPAPGPGYFIVIDSSGGLLGLSTFRVIGNTIEIETSAQKPEKLYTIGLLQKIFAQDGTSIDTNTPQMTFIGYGRAESPVVSVEPAVRMSSSSPAVEMTAPQPQVTYIRNPALPPLAAQPIQQYVPSDGMNQSMSVPDSDLPNSGVGLFGALLATGAISGGLYQRRRKAVR